MPHHAIINEVLYDLFEASLSPMCIPDNWKFV